jgi:hypothetical protein
MWQVRALGAWPKPETLAPSVPHLGEAKQNEFVILLDGVGLLRPSGVTI